MIIKERLYKDTRVKILTDNESLIDEAFNEIIHQRTIIENYIKKNKEFLNSLKPIEIEPNAPEIIKRMANASKIANTGPMAAVAGTLAEFGVKKIKNKTNIAIIENGGDIYAYTNKPVNIGIYSKKVQNLAFKIVEPIAICSSSSFLGHSKSFGKCDLVTAFSKNASIADAVATAACNEVKTEEDINPVLERYNKIKEIQGLLIIKNDNIGMIGNIPEIIKTKDTKEKVTKDPIYEL